jgi:hypothetical protein
MKLIENYYKPTPVLARKIGDSLMGAASIGASYAFATSNNKAAFVLFLMAVVGKFISNFWAVDNEAKSEDWFAKVPAVSTNEQPTITTNTVTASPIVVEVPISATPSAQTEAPKTDS